MPLFYQYRYLQQQQQLKVAQPPAPGLEAYASPS